MNTQPLEIEQLTEKRLTKFWGRVDKTPTCWNWVGACLPKGYGMVGMGKRVYRVHRIAYYYFHKVDPLDNDVLHTCDNPKCVNPSHLFLGTNLDNIKDKMNKGRYNHIKGSQMGNATLSEDLVKLIKQYLAQGYTQTSIAKAFLVTKQTIWKIAHNEAWTHVSL